MSNSPKGKCPRRRSKTLLQKCVVGKLSMHPVSVQCFPLLSIITERLTVKPGLLYFERRYYVCLLLVYHLKCFHMQKCESINVTRLEDKSDWVKGNRNEWKHTGVGYGVWKKSASQVHIHPAFIHSKRLDRLFHPKTFALCLSCVRASVCVLDMGVTKVKRQFLPSR
jgi:hypothetical protein